jgi:hypothetical protein
MLIYLISLVISASTACVLLLQNVTKIFTPVMSLLYIRDKNKILSTPLKWISAFDQTPTISNT